MNPIYRNDAAIARLSELVCVAAGINNKTTGKPLTAADLQPFADVDEPEASPDQLLTLMKGNNA